MKLETVQNVNLNSSEFEAMRSCEAQGVALYLIDIGNEPVTNNGTSRMFFGMLALMAEFERDRIRDRVVMGKQAKAKRGGFVGGAAPFG